MLQSLIRFALTVLFTWLVAKGAVTQTQVDSDLPVIAQVIALVISSLALVAWSWFEKWRKGHITALGKDIPPAPAFDSLLRPSSPAVTPTDKIDK